MTASAALSPVMHLYLDETGARHPDRAAVVPKHGCDWFAIGGLLVNEEDIDHAKAELAAFVGRWPQIRSPLHLTDMRSENKGFAWLGKLDVEERSRFWSEYRLFLARVKVAGTACVIDRPGYVARGYGKRDGDAKWLLCRSAFDIVIDRAAKFAELKKRRLRVFYERADRVTDKLIEGYFKNIKTNGLAFDEQTSAKYAPLSQAQLAHLLITIEGKDKPNKMLQIADSYLYAIARGSYQRKFDIYRKIAESGKLVTSQVDGAKASVIGVKTYCFELVKKGG